MTIPDDVLTLAKLFRATFGDGVRLVFVRSGDQTKGNPAMEDPK